MEVLHERDAYSSRLAARTGLEEDQECEEIQLGLSLMREKLKSACRSDPAPKPAMRFQSAEAKASRNAHGNPPTGPAREQSSATSSEGQSP